MNFDEMRQQVREIVLAATGPQDTAYLHSLDEFSVTLREVLAEAGAKPGVDAFVGAWLAMHSLWMLQGRHLNPAQAAMLGELCNFLGSPSAEDDMLAALDVELGKKNRRRRLGNSLLFAGTGCYLGAIISGVLLHVTWQAIPGLALGMVLVIWGWAWGSH